MIGGGSTGAGVARDAAMRGLQTVLVERKDLALAEIAFLLGFSEPSPFYRAFRRWFGQSPERYRQQLARAS